MASVLAFDADSVKATIDGAAFTAYTLIEDPEDGCTFELSIPVTSSMLGKTITFNYSA